MDCSRARARGGPRADRRSRSPRAAAARRATRAAKERVRSPWPFADCRLCLGRPPGPRRSVDAQDLGLQQIATHHRAGVEVVVAGENGELVEIDLAARLAGESE